MFLLGLLLHLNKLKSLKVMKTRDENLVYGCQDGCQDGGEGGGECSVDGGGSGEYGGEVLVKVE